ncbi:MAG: hypothetical protein KDB07_03065, partial [Planctomycetes bacterium]|nr:hypothetical protein [Planctomycetota bacterium]
LACEALGFLMVSDARNDLERIKLNTKEDFYVRLAAGRALSRLEFRVHDQELDGWSLAALESLAQVLRSQGDKPKALKIVEDALHARKQAKVNE